MEIKAGDKVRIKSWEAMEAEFGLDEDGDINCLPYITGKMRWACGATLTVQEITSEARHLEFFMEEDPGTFFAAWMVEEVIQSEI